MASSPASASPDRQPAIFAWQALACVLAVPFALFADAAANVTQNMNRVFLIWFIFTLVAGMIVSPRHRASLGRIAVLSLPPTAFVALVSLVLGLAGQIPDIDSDPRLEGISVFRIAISATFAALVTWPLLALVISARPAVLYMIDQASRLDVGALARLSRVLQQLHRILSEFSGIVKVVAVILGTLFSWYLVAPGGG